MSDFTVLQDGGQVKFETSFKGALILENSFLNKGTSFSQEERLRLGLLGLLPPYIKTIEEQADHLYDEFKKQKMDLDKHIFLRGIQDRNETLFYYIVRKYIDEMLPMIYTPIVGEACQYFDKIYRKPRGLFISYAERDKIDEILENTYLPDVKAIVVTDGERILGLGDQGIGGMGIPIGKMSLYTACGGLNPAWGLPIVLDVGTNNKDLLNDSFYLGWKHERIKGKEYMDFIDMFVQAVTKKYPKVLLQWEDFAKDHAHLILDKYRDKICTFNDDIQGTASISTAAILAAVKVNDQSIKDQQIVILGGGSAGSGIASQIVNGMVHEGMQQEEAEKRIWIIDIKGLLMDDNKDLVDFQKPFAKSKELVSQWKVKNATEITLEETVSNLHPTILIGVSACAGAFNENIIKEMAQHVEHPVIFPLSNPTANSEATAEDLINWTDGKALIGTGTKFPDVSYKGRTYSIAQCNNHYIFPAMGLGILTSESKHVSQDMFLAAAKKLSEFSPALKDKNASLLPPLSQIPEIAKAIALEVALQAQKEGFADKISESDLKKRIEEFFWKAEYVPIEFNKI